jgi:hypothetical protein
MTQSRFSSNNGNSPICQKKIFNSLASTVNINTEMASLESTTKHNSKKECPSDNQLESEDDDISLFKRIVQELIDFNPSFSRAGERLLTEEPRPFFPRVGERPEDSEEPRGTEEFNEIWRRADKDPRKVLRIIESENKTVRLGYWVDAIKIIAESTDLLYRA